VTTLDDHGTLPAHAVHMLHRLDTVESHHAGVRVEHMQHREFAKRASQLGDHLRSVVALADARRYPSALVVVRAALEHHLMDRLIFLATRYVETYGGIKFEDLPKEEARLAALRNGDRPDIERWWRDDETGQMNVVIRGLHSARSKKGRGQIISPYYFRIEDFDPFTGGKKHAAKLASPFWKRAHREEWATEATAAWRRYFVHDRVIKGLNANHLLPGRMALQVEVHYAFLSGYAHPSKRGYEAVHGHNFPDGRGSFNHFASELTLLYVITIAAAEVEVYGRMARRAPRLPLASWDEVERDAHEARLASDYFWFLGGEPQALDRIDTLHTPDRGEDPKWGRPRRDWRKIRASDVAYYADPLDRLKRLHASWQEMSTGIVHRSPFERVR
jgi:hypothetical protein